MKGRIGKKIGIGVGAFFGVALIFTLTTQRHDTSEGLVEKTEETIVEIETTEVPVTVVVELPKETTIESTEELMEERSSEETTVEEPTTVVTESTTETPPTTAPTTTIPTTEAIMEEETEVPQTIQPEPTKETYSEEQLTNPYEMPDGTPVEPPTKPPSEEMAPTVATTAAEIEETVVVEQEADTQPVGTEQAQGDYFPGFGYVPFEGENIQSTVTSDGDINKQIGIMD